MNNLKRTIFILLSARTHFQEIQVAVDSSYLTATGPLRLEASTSSTLVLIINPAHNPVTIVSIVKMLRAEGHRRHRFSQKSFYRPIRISEALDRDEI